MATVLKQAWWTVLVRGIVAVIIGLLLLLAPGVTLATGALSFVILFGVYALVDGIAHIFSAVTRREGEWVLVLILGMVGVLAGLMALANPLLFALVTVTIMIYIVAFKAIAGGIVEMISAWQLRREIDNEWMLMLSGLFSLLFGLILLARPITGVEVLVLLASFYLLVTGVLAIILSFKLRGWSDESDGASTPAAPAAQG